MRVIGIDGCRAGWVVARADKDLARVEYEVIKTDQIREVFLRAVEAEDVVAIDIPIGLPEDGPRACDSAARAFLKAPRASSVFSAPCRVTLAAVTYADANGLNRWVCDRGISLQAFHLFPKIRAVDFAISPSRQQFVFESHPEVVFARLSGEKRGLIEPKRRAKGRTARQELLCKRLPSFDPLCEVSRLGGRAKLAPDDLIDALACLVAAQNIARDDALVFPGDHVDRDYRGLRMEIVA